MKTQLLFWAGILFLSTPAYSQVGINTPTPSSTLDVRGSVEGNFREITATTDILNPTDYHVSFSGASNSVLNLPSKSATDGSATDFTGRKYYIKNNSTTSTLTLTAASGQVLRLGGYTANANTFVLQPGKSATLTAGTANGWDLDANVNINLVDYNSSTPPTWIQTLVPAGATYTTVPNTSVTVTVPSSNTTVVLYYTGYTMVSGGTTLQNAFGSMRFQIAQSGTATNTYSSVDMVTWYQFNTNVNVYNNFASVYSISNLAPGTYTFDLQVRRETEAGTIGQISVNRAIGRADVYLK